MPARDLRINRLYQWKQKPLTVGNRVCQSAELQQRVTLNNYVNMGKIKRIDYIINFS